MARKVPGVRPRGGKWVADGYDPATQRKRILGTFETQAEAIDAKEVFERTKHKARSRPRWTCDEFAAEWTANYGEGLQASTVAHYNERLNQFSKDFKGVLLADLDRAMARRWATKHPRNAQVVRAMLNDALNDGLLEHNPFAGLRLKLPGISKQGRKNAAILTKDEMDVLIGTARTALPKFPMFARYITVAAYTGMRLGELHGLQWRDIDWKNGVIRVERQWRVKDQSYAAPKNGEARTIAMFSQAEEALRGIENLGPDDLVFYTQRFSRFDQRIHTYYWNQVRMAFWPRLPRERRFDPEEDQAPVGNRVKPDFDFHELRHFTGSWLADRGATAQDIAIQLGHTDGGRLAQELYIHSYEDNALARLRVAASHADERVRATG